MSGPSFGSTLKLVGIAVGLYLVVPVVCRWLLKPVERRLAQKDLERIRKNGL